MKLIYFSQVTCCLAVTALSPVYDPNSLLVQMYFGAPPQPIVCMAVTYDSDTYVTSNSTACTGYESCELFDPSKTDFKDMSFDFSNFSRMVSTGSIMSGSYIESRMAMRVRGRVWAFPEAIFAVASESTVPMCVVGLGPRNGESTGVLIENGTVSPTYANLPALLKQQGVIESASYSLFLAEGSGSLEFGTADYSKFKGPLQLVPIVDYTIGSDVVQHTKAPLEIQVIIGGLSLERNGVTYPVIDMYRPALLAIGMQVTYLPQEFLDAIVDFYGLAYNEETFSYYGPCDLPGSINFNISGALFSVPLNYFLTPSPLKLNSGANACQLLLPPTHGIEYCALGNSFAMANYISIDLETLRVGIAPLATTNLTVSPNDSFVINSVFDSAILAPLFNCTSANLSMIHVHSVPRALKTLSLSGNGASKISSKKNLSILVSIIYVFFL